MTALQLNGSNVAASVVATAYKAAKATGGAETSSTATLSVAVNGWFECSPGVTGIQSPTGSEPTTPSGKQFFLDDTTLDGQTLTSGTYTIKHTMAAGTRTFVATLVLRWWLYNGSTYTQIGSDLAASSQTIATAKTTYTWTGTPPSQAFVSGQHVSYDILCHVTTGPIGGSTTLTHYWSNSGTSGVAGDAEVATAGYASSGTTVDKDVTWRGKVSTQADKDVTWRGKVSQITNKEVTWRGPVGKITNKDVTWRGVLSKLGPKDVTWRGKLSTTTKHDLTWRGLIGHGITKDLTWRAVLSKPSPHDLTWRGKVATLANHDLTWRGAIAKTISHDLVWRGKVLGTGPASGGLVLWANGTGVASFDHARFTEFPDPSLSLAPVGRVGSSSVSWNVLLPSAATTLGMDTSTDDVTWTDLSSGNGMPIPGITGQPNPTVDGFDTDTSLNYTSTFRTGGAVATVAFDTAKSRIALTGGTNALYLNQNITWADIDLFVDMDRSDAGGLCWCFVDANNFYLLVIGDDHASVGTANRATLYTVVANVSTQRAQATIAFVRGIPHRFRVTILAGVMTVTMDGALLFTYTDNAPLAAGMAGLYNNGGTVGSRYSQLWLQPQGQYVSGTPLYDIVTSTFVYTRQRLATTDSTVTPQVQDLTVVAYGPNIDSGTLIPAANYQHTFISKNLNDLAKQSNDAWWIDQNKVFHFHARQALPAPWILSSNTLAQPSDLEVDTNLVVQAANNTLYRNRQTLTGVTNTGPFSNTFIGDGNTTSFTLSFPVALGTVPTITLNGNAQKIAKKGKTGAQWYYAENDPVIAQDTNGTVLVATDVLVVTYTGTFLDTVTVDNVSAQTALAAVAQNSGIVEAVEDVSSRGMTYAAGLVYANQLLSRHCVTGRTITFATLRNGLQTGQILTVFLPEMQLFDAQVLITQIDVTMKTQPGNTVLYTSVVSASELANQGSWQKLFASGLLLT